MVPEMKSLLGEYQAAYKKFYQKNEDGQDENGDIKCGLFSGAV